MGRSERSRTLNKDRGSRTKVNQHSQPAGTTALQEAEALQQRAERRRGADAVQIYEHAAALYREALQHSDDLTFEQQAAAHFGLGETYQGGADCLLTSTCCAAEHGLQAAEEQAKKSAMAMLKQAVNEYQQIKDSDGSTRVDALVNCGNALAAWAELEIQPRALQLLGQSLEAYDAALLREEDALTFGNFADAAVAAAERIAEAGDWEHSREMYSRAMAAFGRACSMSSSANGDDLPGLLHNWGVGLYSAGTHLTDPAVLAEAVAKLKASIGFNRGDVVVMNALGDAFVAQADMVQGQAAEQGFLEKALEEGYGAALQIDRQQSDALVGSAEVHLQLGRGKTGFKAAAHFTRSVELYGAALQRPALLGSFKERSEVRHNYACALCMDGALQAAEQILRELLATGGSTADEILQDPDLKALASAPWFESLKVGTSS